MIVRWSADLPSRLARPLIPLDVTEPTYLMAIIWGFYKLDRCLPIARNSEARTDGYLGFPWQRVGECALLKFCVFLAARGRIKSALRSCTAARPDAYGWCRFSSRSSRETCIRIHVAPVEYGSDNGRTLGPAVVRIASTVPSQLGDESAHQTQPPPLAHSLEVHPVAADQPKP